MDVYRLLADDDIYRAPAEGERQNVDRAVVLTFNVGQTKFLDAWIVDHQSRIVDYPFRLHLGGIMLLPILFPLDDRDTPGAMVFASGCWPMVVINDYSTKPNGISHRLDGTLKGRYATIRCFLYPESKAFNHAIYSTTESGWSGGSPSYPPLFVDLVCKEGRGGLLDLIERSPELTDEDRRMVCRQLLNVGTRDLEWEQDRATRERLQAFIAKTTLMLGSLPGNRGDPHP